MRCAATASTWARQPLPAAGEAFSCPCSGVSQQWSTRDLWSSSRCNALPRKKAGARISNADTFFRLFELLVSYRTLVTSLCHGSTRRGESLQRRAPAPEELVAPILAGLLGPRRQARRQARVDHREHRERTPACPLRATAPAALAEQLRRAVAGSSSRRY